MPISDKHAKILWANAAGRCSFPGCRIRLTSDPDRVAPAFTLGEMAHIKGDRVGASRHDSNQSDQERNSFVNLVLLCPTHHTLIDKPENAAAFTVEKLQAFKEAHESWVNHRLDKEHQTAGAVARAILPFLRENHAAFLSYGPHSQIARANPQSDAHSVWLEERLSTIVPNNRAIAGVLQIHRHLFAPSDGQIIADFLQHARGYERWVGGETSYEGVPRFPVEFERLMESLANDGA